MKRLMGAMAAAAALAACGSGGGSSGEGANGSSQAGNSGGTNTAAAAPSAQHPLQAADGSARGTVSVAQAGADLQVRVEATGLPAGAHGAHIHAVGRCDAPDFASAGPHWNPTTRQHGSDNPNGAHVGDLPNLDVGADGRGVLEFRVPNARLSGGEPAVLDADGGALVIHAKADDYRTDPSGDSGDRIACAVLR